VVIEFDTELVWRDTVAKGWNRAKLAKKARVSAMTVSRFLSGQSKNPSTAAKLASALGTSVDRYMRRAS
jgi:transcriptional regulator with XRE-family HTH domain